MEKYTVPKETFLVSALPLLLRDVEMFLLTLKIFALICSVFVVQPLNDVPDLNPMRSRLPSCLLRCRITAVTVLPPSQVTGSFRSVSAQNINYKEYFETNEKEGDR